MRNVIVRLIRRHRLDYAAFESACMEALKETGMRRPAPSRRLPRLLPESSLQRLYEVVDQWGNLQHQTMLRLLLYTAARHTGLPRWFPKRGLPAVLLQFCGYFTLSTEICRKDAKCTIPSGVSQFGRAQWHV